MAYSSQGSQNGQLDSCNWLADNVISIKLRQVIKTCKIVSPKGIPFLIEDYL